ncbi:MAG: AMP-binding protein [Verrucomicrobiota bacterium]|nr:AMP-binding protein [Verrucomicrobiota bacterium]
MNEMKETVVSLFQQTLKMQRGQTALVYDGCEISYQTLYDKSIRLAGSLKNMGVKKGDRVAVLLKNSPEFIYAFYAILFVGGVVVPLEHYLRADEVKLLINDSSVRCMVSSHDFFDVHQSLRMKVPSLVGIYLVEHEFSEVGKSLTITPEVVSEKEAAVIFYTLATSGRPKGAVLTHENITSVVQGSRELFKITQKDRVVLMMPMHQAFMINVCMVLPLSIGASILIVKSIVHSKHLFKEIADAKATVLASIPQFYQTMALTKIPFYFNWVFPIRMAISTSGPVTPELVEKFQKKFKFPLFVAYGLSEASGVVCCNKLTNKRFDGSVGLPIPGLTISIRNEEGTTAEVGREGEVWIKGAGVTGGYYNQAVDATESIRDGWLQTGDLGMMDKAGYLTITGRRKEMLVVRGLHVYPAELEQVIRQSPGVDAAAVVGKPDDKRGEVPIAFVVAKPGVVLNEKELVRHLKQMMADYKQPREIRIVSRLPMDEAGKILKVELRKIVASEIGVKPPKSDTQVTSVD